MIDEADDISIIASGTQPSYTPSWDDSNPYLAAIFALL